MRLPVDNRLCVFGKIPGRADFIDRGLSPALRNLWEDWVQDGMAAGQRIHGPRWRHAMANAPGWRLHLPAGLVPGAPGLLGVMLPGADAVGRPYPLLLGITVAGPVDPLPLIAGSARWFAALETLGKDALAPGFDPAGLSSRLLPRPAASDLPAASGRAPMPAAQIVGLPMATAAATVAQRLCGAHAARLVLFWSNGGARTPPVLAALPALMPERLFPALIDGHWRNHGWPDPEPDRRPGPDARAEGLAASPPASAPSWDRET